MLGIKAVERKVFRAAEVHVGCRFFHGHADTVYGMIV